MQGGNGLMMSEDQIYTKDFFNKIEGFVDKSRIIIDAPMCKYTSFRAGGNADALIILETVEEIQNILSLFSKENISHILLGNGSNILIKDGGYKGIVVKLGENFNNIQVEGNEITAFAGARLSAVARVAMENSLTGFEFAGGIPGSIGGGVFMNAGAYGGELADILVSVDAVTHNGERQYSIERKDLELGYRNSIFHRTGDMVLSAKFKLKEGNREDILEKMKELTDRRNQKQPVQLPSAGSFFKRPEGFFAGKLIEDSGLKGLSVGGAQVSPLHAGFIVNNGDATATDILQLMRLVQNTVLDKFGVSLEPEVRILGEE